MTVKMKCYFFYRNVCIQDLNGQITKQSYLRIIIKFYQIGVGQGLVASLPFALTSVRMNKNKHAFLAHAVSGTNEAYSPDIMMTTTKTPI